MKLYWTAKSVGDGYTQWWVFTCPSCSRIIERRNEPNQICPSCGVQIHGSVAEYSFKKGVRGKGLVQKVVRDTWEFDEDGRLRKVRRVESEKEVPPDDPAYVFYRRYNLV